MTDFSPSHLSPGLPCSCGPEAPAREAGGGFVWDSSPSLPRSGPGSALHSGAKSHWCSKQDGNQRSTFPTRTLRLRTRGVPSLCPRAALPPSSGLPCPHGPSGSPQTLTGHAPPQPQTSDPPVFPCSLCRGEQSREPGGQGTVCEG